MRDACRVTGKQNAAEQKPEAREKEESQLID
jgi:hypothetical protein